MENGAGDLLSPGPGVVTVLLSELKNGNQQASSQLMDYLYAELRRLAGGYMRQERPDHTLQPTALVHEAFLRLVGDETTDWRNRAHFMALSARVMRRVLVEYARRRNAAKRGGLQAQIAVGDDIADTLNSQTVEMIQLDVTLERLAEMDARLAQVVELRYFGGLSVEETAEVLNISPKTVKRDWTVAKAWLKTELGQ